MKLEEAIEIVTTHTKEPCTVSFDNLKEAELLLIEAGKRIEDFGPYPHCWLGGPLPGETEKRTIQRQGKDSFGDYSYEERTK